MSVSSDGVGNLQRIVLLTVGLFSGLTFTGEVGAQDATTLTAQPADVQSTSTDFLSDDAWRSLSREERRERSRRSMVARYEPSGKPSVDKLAQYIDKFATFTVYDPRYYLFKVTAEHVPGTTGSVVLSGEVFPAHYKNGVQDALESLGFIIAENNIKALPAENVGNAYGISTTSAATLRKEPRRNAEQLNSVALGGLVKVLRAANSDDISNSASGGRHAPGADLLPPDSPEDWMAVQTMEGYIGFSRKADFRFGTNYDLPDGILNFPVTLADTNTTVPAGAFVYAIGENSWKLSSGETLPAGSKVTDLRPDFTAEEIETLMKPFMDTRYVWGGVTDEGIDCSGFTQFFMRTAGVMIPRDAVQQATGGLIVAWGKDVMTKAKPGDLIFFASDNGRISHVAISLGGARIIHSAGRGVHLTRLDEPRDSDSDENNADRVLFARRMVAR